MSMLRLMHRQQCRETPEHWPCHPQLAPSAPEDNWSGAAVVSSSATLKSRALTCAGSPAPSSVCSPPHTAFPQLPQNKAGPVAPACCPKLSRRSSCSEPPAPRNCHFLTVSTKPRLTFFFSFLRVQRGTWVSQAPLG